MAEEERLKKAREGDLKSIEEICSSTWEAIYRFIYFKVQNRQEAEDITQETYVRALSRYSTDHVHKDSYIGYLKTISLNILRDMWRSSRRRGSSINIDAVAQDKASIGDEAENAVIRAQVHEALGRLNDEQRTVIELRIIKGYSVAETARLMSKKEGNIRVIQYRALEALSKLLGGSEL